MDQVPCRRILEVLKDSLKDRPQQQGKDMAEAEVRYKLIIDPSEDDSLVRLLFSFEVLQREKTHIFMCSDFPGNTQLQKVTLECVPFLSVSRVGSEKKKMMCLFLLSCQFWILRIL